MLDIPSRPEAPLTARAQLQCVEEALERPLFEDVRLLVSELVTNSVRHSGCGGTVGLAVCFSAMRVRVEVCDSGVGFHPERRHGDRGVPGGWGLVLVEQLSDRWGVEREGLTRVWLEIDRGG